MCDGLEVESQWSASEGSAWLRRFFLSSVSLQQKLTVLEEAILRVLQVTLKT